MVIHTETPQLMEVQRIRDCGRLSPISRSYPLLRGSLWRGCGGTVRAISSGWQGKSAFWTGQLHIWRHRHWDSILRDPRLSGVRAFLCVRRCLVTVMKYLTKASYGSQVPGRGKSWQQRSEEAAVDCTQSGSRSGCCVQPAFPFPSPRNPVAHSQSGSSLLGLPNAI